MTTGTLTLSRKLLSSLLSRPNALLRVWTSSLTVVSSSLTDCNSSLAVSSSSLVLCNSSLLDMISSLADLSSSLVTSVSSMVDWRYLLVAASSCFNSVISAFCSSPFSSGVEEKVDSATGEVEGGSSKRIKKMSNWQRRLLG